MPAALLMRKLGYKFGFIAGLLLYGIGTILFGGFGLDIC